MHAEKSLVLNLYRNYTFYIFCMSLLFASERQVSVSGYYLKPNAHLRQFCGYIVKYCVHNPFTRQKNFRVIYTCNLYFWWQCVTSWEFSTICNENILGFIYLIVFCLFDCNAVGMTVDCCKTEFDISQGDPFKYSLEYDLIWSNYVLLNYGKLYITIAVK